LGGVPAGHFEDNVKRWGGDHIIDPSLVPGVLFMNRPFKGDGAGLADLAPTILAATGARPGRVQDGLSLLELMRHPHVEPGRDLLHEGLYRAAGLLRFPGIFYSSVRTREWLYTEYSSGRRELYDLIGDPYELRNRDLDPHYAGVEADLARRLAALRRCAGASCLAHPALSLELRYRERRRANGPPCARSAVRLRVQGPDRRRVREVDVYAAGRLVASGVDGRRRFRIPRPRLPTGDIAFRPTAYLGDGRAYTMLARVRVCRGGFEPTPAAARALGAR
jgi:hypothetical protein